MRVVIAVANRVNAVGDIYTEEALRQMASEDERCTFDEATQSLWMETDGKEISVQADPMNADAVVRSKE